MVTHGFRVDVHRRGIVSYFLLYVHDVTLFVWMVVDQEDVVSADLTFWKDIAWSADIGPSFGKQHHCLHK